MIESTEINQQLQKIEHQLKKLDNKIADKKWFTVTILLVTSIVGTITYVAEKIIDKQFISDETLKVIVSKSRAQEIVNSLIKSQQLLSALDSAFEEYCLIDQTISTRLKVTENAAEFTQLGRNSIFAKDLLDDLQIYVNFVANNTYDIYANEINNKSTLKAIYKESAEAYKEVSKLILNRVEELSQ